ncbi:hypothetical protein C8R42DRAFT_682316 [Lentinula raphanica]|nr:hypothetical protein C8R42DRAFT_682316 [Lentinula raphanica]
MSAQYIDGIIYCSNNQSASQAIPQYGAQARAPWPPSRPVDPNAPIQHSRVIAGAVWPPPHHMHSLGFQREGASCANLSPLSVAGSLDTTDSELEAKLEERMRSRGRC